MKWYHIGTFILSILWTAGTAVAAPDSFVYEGMLEDNNGPITTSSTLILRIYDPTMACLLYEEQQSVTPGADGSFSVHVGSAVAGAKRTGNDPQLAMASIFASSGVVRATSSSNCSAGYTASASDSRRLVINVNGTDLSPEVEISSAPFAMVAGTSDKVGAYDPTKLLRSDGSVAVPALTDANVNLLMSILGGSLTTPSASGDVVNKGYVDGVTANYLPLSATFSGDVSGVSTAISVDKIKGSVVDTTGIAANKILKYDGTKWTMGNDDAGTATSLADGKIWVGNAANGPAEVTMTGDASISNTGVVTLKNVGTLGTYVKVETDAQGRVVSGGGLALSDITAALGFTPVNRAGDSMTGSLGINTSPTAALDVNGAANFSGQVGIGTTTPANGAILDIVGTGASSSLILPRDTSASRPTGVNGMVRYATDTNKFEAYENGVWVNMISSGGVTSVSASAPMVVTGTAAAPVVGLSPGDTANRYLRWDGTSWVNGKVGVQDIAGSIGAQIPTTCTIAETLIWSSVSDAFLCMDIKQKDAATVSRADMTIYVGAAGSDSDCNGTASNPVANAPNCSFATLQKAVDSMPDIVRHRITIEVLSNLSVTAAGVPLAVINKSVAAQSLSTGPLIEIKSTSGFNYTMDGMYYTDTAGIVVGGASRGVYIHDFNFNNFTDKAISVDGGLLVLDNGTFNNNLRSISANGGGRLMLGGNININVLNSSSGNTPRGIEVYQASMSSEAALNISTGTGQGNAGLSITYGDVEIRDEATVTLQGSTYQAGVEIGTGGSLSIESGKQLLLDGAGLSGGTLMSVRGGRLSVSGTLKLSNVGNQGLYCQSGAGCDIYGTLDVNSGSSPNPYVMVQSGSTLNVQGFLNIMAPVSTNGAAIQVSDNSALLVNPNGANGISIQNGTTTTNSSAFRVSNNSLFRINSGASTPNLTVTGYSNLVEASNMSVFTVSASSLNGNYSSLGLKADETSKITFPTGMSLALPTRSCPAGMTAIGSGAAGFCIDTSDSAMQKGYYDSLNSCSNRGLKLCSKRQYAMYCGAGSSLSNLLWAEGFEDVTCAPTSMITAAGSSIVTTNYYRCCL